ncbi:GntR family transcriptional regulator [uncultured Sphaerochaeta sp.]|uniref:GntR family transcriptional regulator n=1 Tax=uncultured Sphaerochaeta sp. TaxID=886478 RepID=UPI002A0A6BBF|nr:GntR family transcriptional regulator [uncultured Sphaerochaeta sp.]
MTRNTTTEDIYSILKERILNLQYKPGYSLSAAILSQELNVSRSPVREALIKLAVDNLVEIFPQIGTRVSLINLDKVSEERFLRKSLEESALKEFLTNHTDESLETMRTLIERQKIALQVGNIIEFLKLDDAFHEQIFKAINKPSCWQLSLSFTFNEHRLRLLSLSSVGGTSNSVVMAHTSLLSAVEENKEELALKILHQHLSRISNEIPKIVALHQEIFTYNDAKNSLCYPKKSTVFPENFLETINQ